MLNAIAPAPTDAKERIVKAAVTAVYDRYCSTSIDELESAVVALIGQPVPDEDDDGEAPAPTTIGGAMKATGTASPRSAPGAERLPIAAGIGIDGET